MGVLLGDGASVEEAPKKPPPRAGGLLLGNAPEKPIGHVTTPFEDPKHKPFFDMSAADARIDAQGAKLGATFSGLARATQVPQAFVTEKAAPVLKFGREHNYETIPWSPDFGKVTPYSPVGEAAEAVVTDPLAWVGLPVGGRSGIARLGEKVEEHAFPAVVKAGGLIDKVPGGSAVTGAAAKAHDVLGVHSAAKRELARLHGSQWLDRYAQYRTEMMQHGGAPPARDVEAQIREHLAEVPPGPMRESYEKSLIRASEGLPFSQPISSKVSKLKTVMATGEPKQKALGIKVPERQTPLPVFDKRTGSHYVPHEPPPLDQLSFIPPKHEPEEIGLFGAPVPPPPKIVGRTERRPVLGYSPARLEDAITATAKRFKEEPTAVDPIYDLMKRPGGWAPPWMNAPAEVITGGMFAAPFGAVAHEANISALALPHSPMAVAKAVGRGVVDTAKQGGQLIPGLKNVLPKPESLESIAQRHAPSIRGGAISTHDAGEQGDTFTRMLQAIQDRSGPLKPVVGAYKKLSEAGNESLWKFENEVRHGRSQELVKGGMTPERAGLRVASEMVDYGNRSPLAAALKPGAPFINWGLQMPAAVARGAIENPGRTAALARALPFLYGGTGPGEDAATGKPLKSTLPQAEVFRAASGGIEGAKKYATGRVGAVPRYALGKTAQLFSPPNDRGSAKQRASKDRQNNKYTYGQDPDTFLLNELPLVGKALEMSGHGMFQHGEKPDALSQLLKLIRVGP